MRKGDLKIMNKGTVKWFNTQKGYGFLIDSETKEELFIHYSQIQMDGFKSLNEDDIVVYNLGAGKDGKEQAINVQPFLTLKMIEDSLKKEKLYVKTKKDGYGQKAYMVVDQNSVIQAGEQGMTFMELAAFAGFDTDGLGENKGEMNIMHREQVIEKIAEKYRQYGIEKALVEQIYDMAIKFGVSEEPIYSGMKLIINNTLGINNSEVIKEVGEAFKDCAVNDTRKSNPTASDKVIAKNMKEELEDNFDWKALELPVEITNAIKEASEKFIEKNAE